MGDGVTRIANSVQTTNGLRQPLRPLISKASNEARRLLDGKRWRIRERVVTTPYSAAGKVGKRSAEESLNTTLPPATFSVNDQLRLP
jgi:hypothetical protein